MYNLMECEFYQSVHNLRILGTCLDGKGKTREHHNFRYVATIVLCYIRCRVHWIKLTRPLKTRTPLLHPYINSLGKQKTDGSVLILLKAIVHVILALLFCHRMNLRQLKKMIPDNT